MYSSYRLAVVNLLIGMCRGAPGLSQTIRQMGYRDRWIPGGSLSSRGTADDPVLVLASTKSRHSFFVEVCPGSEVDPAHLDRYSGITAVDLRERTPLSRDQTEVYGVAVFGLHKHGESLRSGIRASRLRPTLLLRTPEGLVIDSNPFPKVALANVFRPVLALDWDSVPLGWVPYDHESHPAEVAQRVIAEVVARASGGAQRVEVAGICQSHLLWGLSTASTRRRLRTRVDRVLATAARREFRDFFRLRGGFVEMSDRAREAIRLPGSPTLRRMLRQQAALLDRLRSG